MMHVAFARDVQVESVNPLMTGQRSQRDDRADLGLTAGKHRGTVHARNRVHLRRQRTDVRDRAAVRTLVILQDHLAHGLLLILVDGLIEKVEPLLVARECLLQPRGDIADVFLLLLLIVRKDRFLHLFGWYELTDRREQFFRDRAALISVFWLSDFGDDLLDKRVDRLVDIVCHVNGLDHLLFLDLLGTGLDHDHFFRCGGHRQLQIALIPDRLRGVYDKLAVFHSDLRHCARTVKRDVGNAGRDRGTDHGEQFRTVLRINGEDQVVQKHVVPVILGKQRPHRTVYDARGQNGIFRRTALSLVESAGDLPDRIQFFLKLYAQREEIDPFPGLLRRGCRREHNRIPIVHQCRSACLGGDPADIHAQRPSGQLH